jgi:hypothetical protein
MEKARLIRDYENTDLSLAERVPSLARRFPCLKGAPGLTPFDPEVFYAWVMTKSSDSSAKHAGLLILNLLGDGVWPKFDAVRAISIFDDENRVIFANWARCWH